MSYFKQSKNEINMENDIKFIFNELNKIKKFNGKSKLINDCRRYLDSCTGWNPLVEEELVKIHKDIILRFKKKCQ